MLRPPFGAAWDIPTRVGSFVHAQLSPAGLRVRQEASVAAGVLAVSDVVVCDVVVVVVVDVAGAGGAGVAGVACGAGCAAAGGVAGAGIGVGIGVWANAIAEPADSAIATAIPIILFMRHLDVCEQAPPAWTRAATIKAPHHRRFLALT